jgi:hypothetical protein
MMNAARSYHPGGVNAGNCDASISFISNDIAIDVWRARSTSAGEEVISGDSAFGAPLPGGVNPNPR